MTELGFMYNFSDWIRDAMNEQGISKNKLSQMAKVSRSTIIRILDAKHMPNVRTLNNIVYALNLDIRDILSFDELIH